MKSARRAKKAAMSEGSAPEVSNMLQSALQATDGESLGAALRQLEDMPQVRLSSKCVFDRAPVCGTVPQKRGVICKLLCYGVQLDKVRAGCG